MSTTTTALSPIIKRCVPESSDWNSSTAEMILIGGVSYYWNGNTSGTAASRIAYTWPSGYEKCDSLTIALPYYPGNECAPGGCKAFFTTKNLGVGQIYNSNRTGPSTGLNSGYIATSDFYSDSNCLNKFGTGWNYGPTAYIKFNLSNTTLSANTTYYVYLIRNSSSTTAFYGGLNIVSTLSYKEKYTVTFNANGGKFSGGAASTSTTKYEGTDLSLSGISTPSKDSVSSNFTITGVTGLTSNVSQTATKYQNFQFKEWNTKADGKGTSYASTASYSTDAAIILYAIYSTKDYTYSNNVISGNEWWGITKSNKTNATYVVKFDGNGGDCTAQDKSTSNITTYKSVEWYSKEGGSGTEYGKTSAFTSAITIYAYFPVKETKTTPITLPNTDSVTRKGYDFINWNTLPSGSGTAYSAGSSYTPTANITLYAFYEAKGLIRVYTDDWRESLVWVYDGSKWVQAIPNIFNGSSWQIGG